MFLTEPYLCGTIHWTRSWHWWIAEKGINCQLEHREIDFKTWSEQKCRTNLRLKMDCAFLAAVYLGSFLKTSDQDLSAQTHISYLELIWELGGFVVNNLERKDCEILGVYWSLLLPQCQMDLVICKFAISKLHWLTTLSNTCSSKC